ncbi:MAG: di-heme oxidoredictase family protein [Longimicrobiales bacterium]
MSYACTSRPPLYARPRSWAYLLVLLLGAALQGCMDAQDPVEEPSTNVPVLEFSVATGGEIGDVLPGTDPAEFEEAAEAFGEAETIEDGLGPLFNEAGCGSCHTTPVMGGSGEQIERRFGRFDRGEFFGYDAGRDNQGGTLRQLFSNGTYTFNNKVCTVPVEREPRDAEVRNVGRRTQPLFGLGLVDAMPDAFFEQLAAQQPFSIRGVVSRVTVLIPDPRDPTQYPGSRRVGRFGWKAGVPSLLVFSGDAYNNEMGITTQSCYRGRSLTAFAFENLPNGNAITSGCNGGDLAVAQPAHPDVPRFADDVVGPCHNGLTEIQDDLLLFTTFMESLAPPPRDFSGGRDDIERGENAFDRAGCDGCHLTKTFITPSRPHNGVPSRFAFRPFSDFLLHDMGHLGDHIGNTGDSVTRTRLMRTQPLWGARFNTSFLHDGRAPDIRSAILAHDGQGEAARNAFTRLSSSEQRNLIKYVLSL